MKDLNVWCEIVCANCRVASVEGTFASTVYRERIREKAIKAGWTVGEFVNLCPRCAKLLAEKEKKVKDKI